MNKKIIMILPMLATIVATQMDFGSFDEIPENAGPTPVEFSNKTKGQFLGRRQAAEADIRPEELTIHYQSDDPTVNYDNLRFYVWSESIVVGEVKGEMVDGWFTATFKPRADYGAHNKFMFIIKTTGTWAGQSTNTEIPYEKFKADDSGKLEVWAVDGEGKDIEVYATKAETEGGKILTAKFADDWKTINVEGTHKITGWSLYAYTSEFYGYSPDVRDKQKENYLVGSGDNADTKLTVKLPHYAPSNLVYLIKTTFETGKTKQRLVAAEHLYETERFETYYDTIEANHDYSKNDLGVTYTPEKSTFKLWAPMCARVTLRIYEKGTPQYLNATLGGDLYDEYLMNYNKDGVWTAEIQGDLNGKYYTYFVSNFSGENEVCDPYAKATGVNGIRSMVLDFDKTDPEGWDKIPLVWDKKEGYDIKGANDLAVYETHIRDLTMDDTWQSAAEPKNPRGTYAAFAEKGTTYTEGDVTVTTGHDHIEEMGFNAVQILPFFDSDNNEVKIEVGDENTAHNYNWGYNPLNYNAVDGLYSTNPHDGALRVTELKNLVMSYANDANKTRIIMDVVYNHVSSVSTVNLNKIMPKYYFRIYRPEQYKPEDKYPKIPGLYADGAGCGNEVKSEAPMMRKLIVDSVQWWATEYKIKGFRFDLMKLIDSDTMRLVKDYLYRIDPDMVCWGEGWALDYNGPEGKDSESWVVFNKLNATPDSPGHLGAFSDAFRDGVRGGNDHGMGSDDKHPTRGFISSGRDEFNYDNISKVKEGMVGIFKGKGSHSEQTVNYASCHDNYTLFDQLTWTLGDQKTNKPNFYEVADSLLAVQSAVTFSSGVSFYNGGEELFRSKEEPENALELLPDGAIPYFENFYGKNVSHNSYASSDQVNAYQYDRKIHAEYYGETFPTQNYFKKYCEMIQSRKTFKGRISDENNGNTPMENSTADVTCNTWDSFSKYNQSTTFAVYIKNHENAYYMFFAGKNGGDIDFGDYNNCDIIYNSRGEADNKGKGVYYDNGKLYIEPKAFVVMQKR